MTSEGIRSGVNWMRLNEQPSTRPSTRTSSVLPSPGTLSIRTWPSARSDVKHAAHQLALTDEDLVDLAEHALGPAHDPVGAAAIVARRPAQRPARRGLGSAVVGSSSLSSIRESPCCGSSHRCCGCHSPAMHRRGVVSATLSRELGGDRQCR